MNISNSQVNRLRHFVRAGLRSLFRPEPQTAVEWADANYYLPKESAYQEGRWETLPFQRAIMNAMGSDYIREVNVVKSARVGYSKMLLGVYAYFIEHKQRNTLIWLTAQLHETLPDGAVIHIVPRVAGAKSGGVFQIVLGAAAIAGSFFTAGATLAAWGAAIGAGGMTGILFSLGASMVLGGVAQMLAPKARTPRTQTTDNGKQNTYFSSLDNMVAQGNVLPVLYGEMRVGSRVVSQEISTADEGDGGQVVVIGR